MQYGVVILLRYKYLWVKNYEHKDIFPYGIPHPLLLYQCMLTMTSYLYYSIISYNHNHLLNFHCKLSYIFQYIILYLHKIGLLIHQIVIEHLLFFKHSSRYYRGHFRIQDRNICFCGALFQDICHKIKFGYLLLLNIIRCPLQQIKQL